MRTWRLMIRLARRDMRRHWGRAVLTATLIALPTMLIAAVATLVATMQVSGRESLPNDLGQAAAAVSVSTSFTPGMSAKQIQQQVGITQQSNGPNANESMGVPGKLLNGLPVSTAAQIAAVTHSTVWPRTVSSTRAVVGGNRIHANVLGVDPRNSVYSGTATLLSGHWPTRTDQMLVTRAGAANGIPTSGHFTLHTDGTPDRRVTVVGTATTLNAEDLVALPDVSAAATNGSTTWLLARAAPVTWADVQDFNAYGLSVESRLLTEHPDLAPSAPKGSGAGRVEALLVVGVVLLTALIAGPAFATSATRHRRALGQLAANGATRAMLRRYVLAQAVVLGVASSVLAAVAGAAVGLGTVWVAMRVVPRHRYGPYELPWAQLIGLVVVGSGGALIAALAPAVAASRVNVVEVLRGGVSSAVVRVGRPIIGLVVACAGGAVLWFTMTRATPVGGELPVIAGAIMLFCGTVLALPWLLAQVARLAGHLPISARMATRDIGRQRSRAASSVAAIMAASAVMTALAIGGMSEIAQSRRSYLPSAHPGEGVVNGLPTQLTSLSRQLTGIGLQVHTVRVPENVDGPTTVAAATLTGCPAPTALGPGANAQNGGVGEESISGPGNASTGGSTSSAGSSSSAGSDRCAAVGAAGVAGVTGTLTILTPADAQHLLDLDASQRHLLDAGGLLLLRSSYSSRDLTLQAGSAGPLATPSAVLASHSLVMHWGKLTLQQLQSNQAVPLSNSVTVPSLSIPANTAVRRALLMTGWNIIVPMQLATAHGWDTQVAELFVDAPGGISAAQEQQVNNLAPDGVTFTVERGYSDRTIVIIEIMIGVFALIMFVVTLIGCALAQAESRADQATLAAVGAPRGIRRRMAASYALAIGLVGSAVGFAVGVVPGVAAAWPLTAATPPISGAGATHLVQIPWQLLVPALLGVPVVAALLAMLVTRSSPLATRRLG